MCKGTCIPALVTALLLIGLKASGAWAQTNVSDVSRFFFSGNGRITLIGEKTGESFSGRYRTGRDGYVQPALEAICRVFGAPYEPQRLRVSLRLIEFLDFLEDRLDPEARIAITSGYRSPAYNRKLRNRGGLAAKASLHQYGMAADFKMENVSARRVWEYVKALGFGGAGYYHGKTVHIDVGPARSWDEKTSGVGTGISDDNKLIGLVTDYDVYLPGEMMAMKFIRMTTFPIGVVPEFAIYRHASQGEPEKIALFKPLFSKTAKGECPKFADIDQMTSIHWRMPKDLYPGRYKIRVEFCDNPWADMSSHILSPAFETKLP